MRFQTNPLITSMLFGCMLLFACTSDPIVPDGTVTSPGGETPQNPGSADLCPEGVISFQYEVLPLILSNCAFSGCHDAASAEDDIVLDSYNNIIKEVEAGDPNESELYESIIETDPDDIMPPPGYAPLTTEQIHLIRDWINQGAENTTCGTLCDSTMASFSANIFPIVQNLCLGCHNSGFSQGNVNLENYNKIIPYVNDESFLGSVEHVAGFSIMPPSGGKMSDCNIAQIKKWITEGALDN